YQPHALVDQRVGQRLQPPHLGAWQLLQAEFERGHALTLEGAALRRAVRFHEGGGQASADEVRVRAEHALRLIALGVEREPHPAQAPEYSKSGGRSCEVLTSSRGRRAGSMSGRPRKNA